MNPKSPTSLFLLAIAVGILVVVVSTVVTPATTIFGQFSEQQNQTEQQQPPGQTGGTPDVASDYNNEASPETKAMFIQFAISQIQNMSNPSISISEAGDMTIYQSGYNEDTGEFQSIYVSVPHPFTNANGYKVDNGVLIAPNGSQIFP